MIYCKNERNESNWIEWNAIEFAITANETLLSDVEFEPKWNGNKEYRHNNKLNERAIEMQNDLCWVVFIFFYIDNENETNAM